ncbi:LamG domain-containing protein [Mesoflavibacter zeaxanthinifaciens]|uniref:LamG domain-containing protein n=1 Tax=Mesoflavibacter zeaxanthinifaciens TaxID=393060 RepID=UPI0026EC7C39|nr:LamG domain-containing protein [Mesoflavibacter zeaxanthinifaciens]
MKNLYYIITAAIIFTSCGKKKDTKIKLDNDKTFVEKEINIEDLSYQLSFDGIKSEGDYDEVVATYASNRFGDPKKAMSMDGLSEYAKIDNHEKINHKDEITLSIWYKPISFKGSGNNPLIAKYYSKNEAPFFQYFIGVTGNEYTKYQGSIKFALSIDGKYQYVQTKNNTLKPNQWYNITASYDGVSMKLYVNGQIVTNRAVVGKLDIYNSDLFIGKTLDSKVNTPGTYDNFMIFNRALNKQEVLELSL